MFLLVEDAYRLWREIPDVDLTAAVEDAIKEAGAFMATAGLVAKCWGKTEAKKSGPLELSSPRSDSTIDALRQEQARWDALTPDEQSEEQAEWRLFWQSLRSKVGGAA